ncbi:MAG: D-alanyl-D-alanine carboxypeptidase [Firmicutes bacterium]|nr:D-alanyl-D-alanine carboxypeptidase [Bacillota bacterium]
MKFLRGSMTLLLLTVLSLTPLIKSAAQAEPAFEMEAEAALLMEVNSGKIVWEKNSRKRLYPASLTKIMSLLLALEKLEEGQISLGDKVRISARASSMGGTELFLSEGDRVTLENLLIGMAVGSANDAAVAVAEHISGSVEAFAALMNERAAGLGLEQSHFVNPHGLHHPDHYSCAYDVMLMSLALLEHPRIHRWATIWMEEHFLKGQIRSGEVYLSNTNRMVMDYPGCDGLKTGFTREAGNSIAATAQKGKSRFLAVVMGSPTEKDRYDAARALLDHGFGNYKSVPVVKKRSVVAEISVEKGLPPETAAMAAENLSLLLPQGADEEYTREIELYPVELPLKAHQKVGELLVRYGENEKIAVELIVQEEVRRAPVGTLFLRLLRQLLKFGR